MKHPILDQALREVATGREDPAPTATGDHVDDLVLARFLEGRLDAGSRRSTEAHLSTCRLCRKEWLAARELIADLEPESIARLPFTDTLRSLWSLGRRPAVSAAFGLVALVIGALLLSRLDHGVGDDAFAPFMADQADLVRALEAGGVEPLAPSFDFVDTVRPSFEWTWSPDATAYRLLLIDTEETVVGVLEQSALEMGLSGERVLMDYPADFSPLVPGGVYAWKVDARMEGMWVASAFVPFRVKDSASLRSATP